MKAALHIATDVLREAVSRKWILGLVVMTTLLIGVLAAGLRLDVVDGALAATSFFGKAQHGGDIRAVDVALRPVFQVVSVLVFAFGPVIGILACADFAPTLLAPGRIEHLLALPVSRASILLGVFLGVNVIMVALGLYGGLGVIAVLAVKTGVWMPGLLRAVALGAVAFALVYAVMLIVTLWARSAALSAVCGLLAFGATLVASLRDRLNGMIEEGVARSVFDAVTYVLPPVFDFVVLTVGLGENWVIDGAAILTRVAGLGLFTIGVLAVGIWRFEGRDF